MKTAKLKYLIPIALIVIVVTSFKMIEKKEAVLDNYKVIKVDGRIVFLNTGRDMHTGDQFTSNEKLDFKSQDSRAAVISKLKGRFVLTPSAKSSSASKLLPAMNNVSSRAGALINAIDLKNHFSDKYLILDEMELKVGKDVYPMSKDNFFYLQYTYEGETIPKKLPFHGDTLELSPKDIYTIDGKPREVPLNTKTSIYYRDNAAKKSVKISEFNMIVPNNEELKDELNVITGELSDKKSDKVKNEITAYLNEFYGKPQKENLKDWLSKNMKM